MAVAGFCMGGGFAILYAARAPIGAAADFYGAVPEERGALEGICPVVGAYGGRDRVFGGHAERLRGHLEKLGVEHEITTYPDAGHSFMSRYGRLQSLLVR
ncbi:MAG: dienelactone hydrolase family protein, partial [Gammaproteobacteria bacterium]|nr:dienelactone hydrolase family protein [Gammaproteobacteria bacterium]